VLRSAHFLLISIVKHKYFTTVVLLLGVMLFSGCATTGSNGKDANSFETHDPYENVNRKSYVFTDVIDRKILEPISDYYVRFVPNPMRRSIGHFYDNLLYPNVFVNAFLQGKMRQGAEDTLRFVVNSSVGVAGLFDVASRMGLPAHDEDFGQTLGVWGMDARTYLFIPLLGPSTDRDVSGIPFAAVVHPMFWIGWFVVGAPVTVPITVLGVIEKRARLSGPMRIRDEAALEPYLFVRDAYLQQRKHLIYDGNPPPEVYEDPAEEVISLR
jgi:phospholipid-binding lipoprotein MlaA